MGDDDKRKFEAGATIQIDLDQVQLVDLEAVRKAPPPLPPEPATAPKPTSRPSQRPSAPPAASTGSKNALYVGLIVIVVALAIVAGLAVARGVRGPDTPAPSAAPAPSGGVLTIPPIEVK